MSVEAMSWAWRQSLPPTTKLILMALADAADESGACWPRVRTIAARCCLSERTVQRILKDFENLGVLQVTPRYISCGRQTSNIYRLDLNGTARPRGDSVTPSPQESVVPPACETSGVTHCRGMDDPAVTGWVISLCQGVDDTRDTLGGDMVLSPREPSQDPKAETPRQPTNEVVSGSASPPSLSTLHWPRQLSVVDKNFYQTLLTDIPYADAQVLLDELSAALSSGHTIKTNPQRWFAGVLRHYRAGDFTPGAGLQVAALRQQRMRRHLSCRPPAAPVSRDVAQDHLARITLLLQQKTPPGVLQGD